MQLGTGEVILRPLILADADQLATLMTRNIWDNLRDHVPFPYHKQDAVDFIKICEDQSPVRTFAVLFQQELCGVAGIIAQSDIYRMSGEVGYWIGEPYWGKGIATKALKILVDYGFNELKLNRLFACTFSHNKESQRVIEKCGFRREGIAKQAVIKNDQILDEHRYALLASDYKV